MLGSVPVLADAVVEQLCRSSDRVVDAHQPLGAASEQEADFLSANIWRAIWPAERYNLSSQSELQRQLCFSLRSQTCIAPLRNHYEASISRLGRS